MAKPHNGRIASWRHVDVRGKDGELVVTVIYGTFLEHPDWGGGPCEGRTGPVVFFDAKSGEIETRNSRYTLVGSEQVLQ